MDSRRLWRVVLWGTPLVLAIAVMGRFVSTRIQTNMAASAESAHQFTSTGGCAVCHGESEPSAGTPVIQSCASCHDDHAISGVSGAAADRHLALECTDCHDPHSSEPNALLFATQEELCVTCHDEANQSAQKYSHFQDGCERCHDAHATAENYLKASTVILCQDNCHVTHKLARSHPVGEGTYDKYAKSEITCTSSCHRIHGSNYETYLAAHPDKICYRCHAEIFYGKAGPFSDAIVSNNIP